MLVDGESVLALSAVHCLTAAGFEVHLLCDELRGRTRLSRFVKSVQVQPTAKSPQGELERVSNAIKNCGAAAALPIGTDAFYFCARFKEALSKLAGLPPLPDPNSVLDFGDKGKTAKFCAAHGISHPASHVFDNPEKLWAAADRLPYPMLLKPKEGTGSKGIERANSAAELRQLLATREADVRNFVYQQFVDGWDVDCSVLCADGEVLSAAVQRRPQTKGPAPFGVIEFLEHPATLEIARRVVKAARFSGVAHMDCRVDQTTGASYLLEVNPRIWGSLGAADVAGVNFPAALARLALGEPAGVPEQVEACLFVAVRNLPAFLPKWLLGSDPAFARRPFRTDWLNVARDPAPFVGGVLSRIHEDDNRPRGRKIWDAPSVQK